MFYELFILSIIKTFLCHVKSLNVFFVKPVLALSQSVKPFVPIWKLFDIYLPLLFDYHTGKFANFVPMFF